MHNQKICIVGGGLTGLITAIALSKLGVHVDLIYKDKKNTKSSRFLAISENNYKYLKNLKIFKFSEADFWPCQNMNLYTNSKINFNKIFEINREKKNKNVFYMINNYKLINKMLLSIKKNHSIKLVNKKVLNIINSGVLKSIKFDDGISSKYNLVIICTGGNSEILKYFPDKKSLFRSYQETSVTLVLKHAKLNNNTARQIFLNNEILALLPISNTETSIVWSIKKKSLDKRNIKNKINFYTKDFLKKIKFNSKIEFNDLNLSIRNKYFQDRILFFGDVLHLVHPMAGQGFNMVLRDLDSLVKILSSKINLGLDIGSYDNLSKFANETRPKNFIYSLGIDFLKNAFSLNNESIKKVRNEVISNLNKSNLAKDIFINIADKGLKF